MPTKKTNTTTKRLQSVIPVGTTIATRPNNPMEGESNTVKVSNTSQGIKAVRNTRQYNTTSTGESGFDNQAYADMQTHAPSDRAPDPVFEYVSDSDAQAQRKAEGKAIIPEWTPTGANTNDPHAVNRTYMTLATYRGTVDDKAGTLPAPAYHKGPSAKSYTLEDNDAISMMSTGQIAIHSPINSVINHPASP